MRYNSTKRIYLLSFTATALSLALVTRLFFIQIVNGDDDSKRGDRPYVKPSSDIMSRGSIFFQEKSGALVSAATLKTVFIIAINPNILNAIDRAYSQINEVVRTDRNSFFEKALKKNDPYEIVTRLEEGDLSAKHENFGYARGGGF